MSEKTREKWLNDLAHAMSKWFVDLGFPLPEAQVQTAFPSSGKRTRRISESWQRDGQEQFVVVVRPDAEKATEVAAALAFQLCQIAAGQRDEHGLLFKHLAISIGLSGHRKEDSPGALFKELAAPLLKKLGPLPKSTIKLSQADPQKTQPTRLRKVSCLECGYVARVSRKWLDKVGPPHCPDHGPMTIADT
ncbi:hypothetical protein [Pyruvatibacter sp.]|uniref:hypothetical protein n=1 Tax=Pyruvatibacter sp. TaxID=1981328 RepID=UPI0032647E16